jgi:hypothetical protein
MVEPVPCRVELARCHLGQLRYSSGGCPRAPAVRATRPLHAGEPSHRSATVLLVSQTLTIAAGRSGALGGARTRSADRTDTPWPRTEPAAPGWPALKPRSPTSATSRRWPGWPPPRRPDGYQRRWIRPGCGKPSTCCSPTPTAPGRHQPRAPAGRGCSPATTGWRRSPAGRSRRPWHAESKGPRRRCARGHLPSRLRSDRHAGPRRRGVGR